MPANKNALMLSWAADYVDDDEYEYKPKKRRFHQKKRRSRPKRKKREARKAKAAPKPGSRIDAIEIPVEGTGGPT